MLAINNQKGFSLTELMVAVGLSGILIYAVTLLFTMVSNSGNGLLNSADFDNDLDRMEYLVERQFRLAVSLTSVGATSLNAQALSSTGYLRTIDSTAIANTNTTVNTIALFYREGANIPVGASSTVRSSFLPTGVYFQQPGVTAGPPITSTYGVLYIDEGSTSATTVQASKSKVMISPLTSVIINASDMDTWSSSNMTFVRSFKITLGSRVATGSGAGLVWCPPAQMGTAPCTTSVAYKDVSRTFTVKLVNNVDSAMTSTVSLLTGRLYFTK